jgi:hypothetical protein
MRLIVESPALIKAGGSVMIDVFLMVLSVDVEMAVKQASRGTAYREESNARCRATQDSHPFSPN